MKHDEILRLQAWMDGQLTGREATEAEALAATEAGTRALAALRSARATARAAGAEWPLPETREFFWSRVRRGIEAAEGQTAPAASPTPGWVRWLLPLGAAAALAVLFLPRPAREAGHADGLAGQTLQAPLDDVRAVVFHSQSDGVTVIWVADAEQFAMY
ncbi:MAG: hypothetical protein ACKVYV_06470 [Limisphaerales bacterium]